MPQVHERGHGGGTAVSHVLRNQRDEHAVLAGAELSQDVAGRHEIGRSLDEVGLGGEVADAAGDVLDVDVRQAEEDEVVVNRRRPAATAEERADASQLVHLLGVEGGTAAEALCSTDGHKKGVLSGNVFPRVRETI